jgi:glycosyltransferase involved in cell wall biosynthesis
MRKRLLLLSPIMPDDRGNGLAMRAGVTLRALSSRFDVHLCLVPVAGGLQTPSSLVRECAATCEMLPLAQSLDPAYRRVQGIADPAERRRAALSYPHPLMSRFSTGEGALAVEKWRQKFDAAVLHIMRLYLAPLAQGSEAEFRVLDLDEDDVTTFGRIAGLYRRYGNHELAEMQDAEAAKFATLSRRHLDGFHRILVSSPVEAERIRKRIPNTALTVVPNAAPPAVALPRRTESPDRPLRLFFVGNLYYLPNEDAVIFLCREILPQLRTMANRPVAASVVGAGATRELTTIAAGSGVQLLGAVDDLSPLYAEADVAVVPIRAGGGTRIKILEAFSFQTPVVATSVGIEGIEARNGEHALIADDPEAFARACMMLATDPTRARDMAARAHQLAKDVYWPNRIEAALFAAYDACL